MHATRFANDPDLRRVWVLQLIHLYDLGLLEGAHVDDCVMMVANAPKALALPPTVDSDKPNGVH